MANNTSPRLIVNGRAYGGWKDVSVVRSIEGIAGKFSLNCSERWSLDDYWSIDAEDKCQVLFGDVALISGFVDRRECTIDANEHRLRFDGRDATAALVDCSVDLGTWEFLNKPVLDICRAVAAQHGITVTLQPGIDDPAIGTTGPPPKTKGAAPNGAGTVGQTASAKIGQPIAKFAFSEGDSGFEVIDRACRLVGLLPVSDGIGGVILTRAGELRASTALVEGVNVLEATSVFDESSRYSRYVVVGQSVGNDESYGRSAAAIRGQALDQGVRRVSRVLRVRADGSITTAFAKQRAAWEATVRGARALSLDVTVQGWTQDDATLWPINALVTAKLPSIGIASDMLIVAAEYTTSDERGSLTRLTLALPGSYVPEPVIPPRSKGTSGSRAIRELLSDIPGRTLSESE